jgi:hypothetical protein
LPSYSSEGAAKSQCFDIPNCQGNTLTPPPGFTVCKPVNDWNAGGQSNLDQVRSQEQAAVDSMWESIRAAVSNLGLPTSGFSLPF